MTDASLVYVTTASPEDAMGIADALLEARLVACANVIEGMTSIYRWQGKIERSGETVLILKTRTALVSKVIEEVKKRHTYQCPCVISWPITAGNEAFLRWIEEETAG